MAEIVISPLVAGSDLPAPKSGVQRHKARLTVPMTPGDEAECTVFGDAQLLTIPAELRTKETDQDYEIPQVKVTFDLDGRQRTFFASFEGKVPAKGETVLVQCGSYPDANGLQVKTAHIVG